MIFRHSNSPTAFYRKTFGTHLKDTLRPSQILFNNILGHLVKKLSYKNRIKSAVVLPKGLVTHCSYVDLGLAKQGYYSLGGEKWSLFSSDLLFIFNNYTCIFNSYW